MPLQYETLIFILSTCQEEFLLLAHLHRLQTFNYDLGYDASPKTAGTYSQGYRGIKAVSDCSVLEAREKSQFFWKSILESNQLQWKTIYKDTLSRDLENSTGDKLKMLNLPYQLRWKVSNILGPKSPAIADDLQPLIY